MLRWTSSSSAQTTRPMRTTMTMRLHSEVEHCYGSGKLRNVQSAKEFERNGKEPENVHKPAGNCSLNPAASNGSINGMRPPMSLAQLCDLTPKEASSS
ncbi:uncharacterized protein LOC110175999 isoform X2 [Drosophila serrata]|uniref:uncharacterized protein LOC110175999 isoform X2 n=1 Tax=Drosophila serrata TaxID=7274 RepID=UPI000A1D07DA|nr:uncharacterized protein LOC110175999 isoform X2 [Drosophila serrata]